MAASTSSSTLMTKPQTPDLFFSYVQESKETLYNQTVKSFESFYPKWEAEYGTLEEFQINVRNRGHDFQSEKVKPMPKREELDKERDKFLTSYWAFRGTYEKIVLYSIELSKRVEFLTSQPRSYYEEERLKKEQPELLEGIKTHEVICNGYIVKMQEFAGKTNTLKGKYFTCIHNDTYNVNWALQRFCQIVDNNGKPLSGWTRGWDNLTTPVIPTVTSSLVDSSQMAKEKVKSGSDKQPQASSEMSSKAATPQPQSEVASAPNKEDDASKSKEASSSKAATPQTQPEVALAPNKEDDASKSKEASSSKAATPQPQPEVSLSQNKEVSTSSPATNSERVELSTTANGTETVSTDGPKKALDGEVQKSQ